MTRILPRLRSHEASTPASGTRYERTRGDLTGDRPTVCDRMQSELMEARILAALDGSKEPRAPR